MFLFLLQKLPRVDLGQHINKLLFDNDLVIIPGFGAFVLKYKPAEINEESDEILPPTKEITFDQKIRNNDGLLVGAVANELKISHFDALKEIERERENLHYQLDKGERVTIEKTGILYYDSEHNLCFEALSNSDIQLDSFGLETAPVAAEKYKGEATDESAESGEKEPEMPDEDEAVSEVAESVVEIPKAAEPVEETPEVAGPDEEAPENDKPTIEKPVPEEQVDEPGQEPVAVEESTKTDEPVQEEKVKSEVPKEPSPTETKEKDDEPEPIIRLVEDHRRPRKKKKRGWLWFLAIIPVLLAGYFILNKQYDFYGNNRGVHKDTIDVTVEIPPSTLDSSEVIVVTDTTKIDTTLTAPVDSIVSAKNDSSEIGKPGEAAVETSINQGKYILVGGSFKNKENADKYLEQLVSDGFKPFHLGKRGNFYIVGIGRYNSEEEASQAKVVYLSKSPNSGVWIKKE